MPYPYNKRIVLLLIPLISKTIKTFFNQITFLRIIGTTFILMCCNFCARSQGGFSNQGTEFWTAYMDHISGAGGTAGSQMSLYITADVNTTVKIEIANIFSKSYNVVARD